MSLENNAGHFTLKVLVGSVNIEKAEPVPMGREFLLLQCPNVELLFRPTVEIQGFVLGGIVGVIEAEVAVTISCGAAGINQWNLFFYAELEHLLTEFNIVLL